MSEQTAGAAAPQRVTEKRLTSERRGAAATAVVRAGRWAWLLGYATASLLAAACTAEPSRSGPATSVRVAPARPSVRAAASSPRSAARDSAARDSAERDSASRDSTERDSAQREPVAQGPASRTPGQARLASERQAREPSGTSVSSARRGPGTPAGAELAPGVNDEFDEDVLLDLDGALAATDENAFATLFKTQKVLVDGEFVRKEKSSHPDNCRRWRALRAKGYAPKSATSRHLDAGALVRCGCLEFLTRAKPSRVSHVRNLLSGAGPSTLPALVASAASPLALEARGRAVTRGATLAELLPAARVIPSELPGRLSIAEPTSEATTILNAEVWGDINSDEVEDLVLSVLNTSDDGTYFELRLVQVTRASPDAPVTVLTVLD